MARFVSSFSGVLIILIMVLVGYVLTKKVGSMKKRRISLPSW